MISTIDRDESDFSLTDVQTYNGGVILSNGDRRAKLKRKILPTQSERMSFGELISFVSDALSDNEKVQLKALGFTQANRVPGRLTLRSAQMTLLSRPFSRLTKAYSLGMMAIASGLAVAFTLSRLDNVHNGDSIATSSYIAWVIGFCAMSMLAHEVL